MPMPSYSVICYAPACPNPGEFKIAARWSDGLTNELKTYHLSCAACLPELYASAVTKRAMCRLAPGETLDVPGIYELQRGGRDKTLKRRVDLENSPL